MPVPVVHRVIRTRRVRKRLVHACNNRVNAECARDRGQVTAQPVELRVSELVLAGIVEVISHAPRVQDTTFERDGQRRVSIALSHNLWTIQISCELGNIAFAIIGLMLS